MNKKVNPQSNQSEETALNSKTNPVEKNKKKESGVWKRCLVGGIPGIILGAAGTFAGSELAAAEVVDEQHGASLNTDGADAEIHEVAPVAGSVNDEMSFAEAFAEARAEVGPGGVFSWHGQVYSTYNQNEWEGMSEEQRQEYSDSVSEADVKPEPYTPSEDAANDGDEAVVVEQETTEENTPVEEDGNSDDEEVIPVENTDGSETDIQVVEVSEVDSENGETGYVGVGEVDGHYAEFQDTDGDGAVDQIAVDSNDNGVIEADEIVSVEGEDVQISDLEDIAVPEEQLPMPDDDLYADMPDYTNDADISSLC